jgi:hypothetical protein
MQTAEDKILIRVRGAPVPVRCRRDTDAQGTHCHLHAIRFTFVHFNTTRCQKQVVDQQQFCCTHQKLMLLS